MDINLLIDHIRQSAQYIADRDKLSHKARWMSTHIEPELKTQAYYQGVITRITRAVYNGDMGGDFIDIMANLIQGQLTQAFTRAWADNGGEGDIPVWLQAELSTVILNEFDFVDQFYRDIVDARVDGLPIDPLLDRARMWANRYSDAYDRANLTINVQKSKIENKPIMMRWEYGDTEHCATCQGLNGVVAPALVWDASGLKPKNPPNNNLDCGGWRCQCSLTVTDAEATVTSVDELFTFAGA